MSEQIKAQSNGQIVGYVRVSATDQNPVRQYAALGTVDRVFEDKASGKDTNRPKLQEMLGYVREGDTIKVKSPDRLARNTRELLDLIEKFKNKGVTVQFTDNPALNTDSSQGEFMLTILGAVAQLERSMIRERQAEGIAVAKAAGKYKKGAKLSEAMIQDARERIEADVPKAVIARELKISRTTLNAALDGTGVYADQ